MSLRAHCNARSSETGHSNNPSGISATRQILGALALAAALIWGTDDGATQPAQGQGLGADAPRPAVLRADVLDDIKEVIDDILGGGDDGGGDGGGG